MLNQGARALDKGPGDGKYTSVKIAKLQESCLSQVDRTVGALRASIVDGDNDALVTNSNLDLLTTPGAFAV
jgi:hypothetical protein